MQQAFEKKILKVFFDRVSEKKSSVHVFVVMRQSINLWKTCLVFKGKTKNKNKTFT